VGVVLGRLVGVGGALGWVFALVGCFGCFLGSYLRVFHGFGGLLVLAVLVFLCV